MNNTVTSEEVNYLVFRYLQESGYVHSAFSFGYESHIVKSNIDGSQIPPGALLSFLQRGLSYVAIESTLSDSADGVNDGPVSLIDVHRALVSQPGPYNQIGEDDAQAEGGVGAGCSNKAGKPSETAAEKIVVSDSNSLILQGHTADVYVCAWNPNKSLLACGSGDSDAGGNASARIWSIPDSVPIKSGESVAPPTELWHDQESGNVRHSVTSLEWSPDGTKLATGCSDGMARIWSESGELLHVLRHHKDPLFSLKWNRKGEYLLSGGMDKTVVVWKASNGRALKQFCFHTGAVFWVDWKDDTTFASCSSDNSILVCRYGEDEPLATYTGHTDDMNMIQWDPSGKLLASCSDDNTAKIWSMGQSTPVHDLREHKKEILAEAWCPASNKTPMLATSSFDTTVKLWDINTGECLNTLNRHQDAVYSIAFSQDGNYIVSGSYDNTVRLWSVKGGGLVRTWQCDAGVIKTSWNASDTFIAAGLTNSTACVIDPRTGGGTTAMSIG